MRSEWLGGGNPAERTEKIPAVVQQAQLSSWVALEPLLPDRWLADHPEHRLEQREEESREAQARR